MKWFLYFSGSEERILIRCGRRLQRRVTLSVLCGALVPVERVVDAWRRHPSTTPSTGACVATVAAQAEVLKFLQLREHQMLTFVNIPTLLHMDMCNIGNFLGIFRMAICVGIYHRKWSILHTCQSCFNIQMNLFQHKLSTKIFKITCDRYITSCTRQNCNCRILTTLFCPESSNAVSGNDSENGKIMKLRL